MNGHTREKILIIGGSSGIGLASAELAIEKGYAVIIASRSNEKLLAAKQHLKDSNLLTFVVDITDEHSIQHLFECIDKIDHLVLAGSEVQFGAFKSSPIALAQQSFDSKFFGPYRVIKAAITHLSSNGSITLFSGTAGAKPMVGSEIISAINGAVEGFSRALAVNLAPVRVNCIAPGLVDTPAYAGLTDDERKDLYAFGAESSLVKRVGSAAEVAQAVHYLINNNFTTGTTMYVDGGHVIS